MKKNTQEIIDTLKKKDKIRVLFVCLGNICRSPAAEGVLRDIVEEKGDENRWEIDSAGTGGYHVGDLPDRRMRVHASRRGLNLTHICRQVKYADFENFDLIIAMACYFHVSTDYLLMGKDHDKVDSRTKLLDVVTQLTEIAKSL